MPRNTVQWRSQPVAASFVLRVHSGKRNSHQPLASFQLQRGCDASSGGVGKAAPVRHAFSFQLARGKDRKEVPTSLLPATTANLHLSTPRAFPDHGREPRAWLRSCHMVSAALPRFLCQVPANCKKKDHSVWKTEILFGKEFSDDDKIIP